MSYKFEMQQINNNFHYSLTINFKNNYLFDEYNIIGFKLRNPN